jgi:hypothetical protein
MSDTPRTDASVSLTHGAGYNSVDPNFARTLERELAAAKAECERLRPHSLSAGEREDYHDALTELTRLRAEVERWKTVAAQMSEEREHNANEAALSRAEVERRNDIINRASVQFFHDGSDGETAAKMLTVLNEAKP